MIIISALGTYSQMIVKWTGRFGNKRTNGDDPNHRINKLDYITEKCPRDWRKLC